MITLQKKDFIWKAEITDQTIVMYGRTFRMLVRRDADYFTINDARVSDAIFDKCDPEPMLFGSSMREPDDFLLDGGYDGWYDGERLILSRKKRWGQRVEFPMSCDDALESLGSGGVKVDNKIATFASFPFKDILRKLEFSREMWKRRELYEFFDGYTVNAERIIPFVRCKVNGNCFLYKQPETGLVK